jgi:glyoxylase-like metal-dependent hydrolase (beta-lactamase superfamily II)
MAAEELDFPWEQAPKPGEPVEVAPGLFWMVTTLPFRLRAINLWLIADGDGWTMIDCGFPLPEIRAEIEKAWDAVLGGKPITRLILTHHHPDHIGNCAWICERWGLVPWITAGEMGRGRWIIAADWEAELPRIQNFYRLHGLSEERVADLEINWKRYRHLFFQPPEPRLITDGEVIRIGADDWRVIVVRGHSIEQAVLYCPTRKLLISGDQVLARISPNVSVFHDDPDATPLALFLGSNAHLADVLPDDVLVLPSHHRPFYGVKQRIRELAEHHEERLDLLRDRLDQGPLTTAASIPLLFGELDGHQIGFAMGEALAHLQHLVGLGDALREMVDGTMRFRRA